MIVKGQQGEKAAQACILDGKALAQIVRAELKEKVSTYAASGQRKPGLAVVLVGEDPASALYVQGKIKACHEIGFESFLHKFEASVQAASVIDCLKHLNEDKSVDGILVQLPLPKHISADQVLSLLACDKDVDGLTAQSLGRLLADKPGLRPCTPSGIIKILDHFGITIEGKRAVVIGRSILVGKPIALMLMQRNATVTVCHSRSQNLADICRQADILVACAGKKELIKASWIKPGACVIDVGIHHEKKETGEKLICGDVDFGEAKGVAGWITPVPGGVGPMTIAMLLANTLFAYEEHLRSAP